MNIAVAIYTTKYGTEPILFQTPKQTLQELPPITNELLESAGAMDPDLDGGESAVWLTVLPVAALPIV